MRILHLNLERGWRGGERQTLLCLRHQRDAGHPVALLARAGGALAARAQADGITVHTVAGSAGLAAWLLRHRREHDILHAQTAQAMTWLALLRPLLRGRIVFTRRTAFDGPAHRPPKSELPKRGSDPLFHHMKKHGMAQDGGEKGSDPLLREKEGLEKGGLTPFSATSVSVSAPAPAGSRAAAWKWRQADGLAAISQAAARAMRAAGLAPVIIASAIEPVTPDPARCAALADSLGLGSRRVLGTAAALSPEKDPLTLIDAVHRLRQQRDDVVFVHFGADGAAGEAARQRVASLGLQDTWLFAGFQAGVEALYPLLDVFVLSSREEALGSSVLDAFLAGVPVAATDAGGLPELLADGRGLLSPVGDSAALAASLARLLDDPALRARCIRTAYDYVLAEHDASVMAGKYLALYEHISA